MCLPALHPTRLGDLYYGVFQQAGLTTAAVAGTCPIVGVGGHFLCEWAVSVRKGGGAAGGSAGAQPSSLRRPVPCTRSPGGGVGFLSSLHGMACDQLLSLTMVDARGDVLVANPTTHSDLFKASCGGGGGNFGIVTSFTVKLVQVCGVVCGAVRCGAVRCGAVRWGAEVRRPFASRLSTSLSLLLQERCSASFLQSSHPAPVRVGDPQLKACTNPSPCRCRRC